MKHRAMPTLRRRLVFQIGFLALVGFLVVSQNQGCGFSGNPNEKDLSSLDSSGFTKVCSTTGLKRPDLRRLNTSEYLNSVRDLTGATTLAAIDLPSDSPNSHGFSNDGKSQYLSSADAEKYLQAAEKALTQVWTQGAPKIFTCRPGSNGLTVQTQTPVSGATVVFQENDPISGGQYATRPNEPNMYVNGVLKYTLAASLFSTPVSTVVINASGTVGNGVWARFRVRIDGQQVLDTEANSTTLKRFEINRTLAQGTGHTVEVEFYNNYFDASLGDRNLFVPSIELLQSGSLTPTACRDNIIRGFAKRAWRRPASEPEVARLTALAGSEAAFDDGIRQAVLATLMSPNFLFMLDQDAASVSGKIKTLGSYELASRLSFFLWSSVPDEELMAAAESGALQTPDGLLAQVRRLLNDTRAAEFVASFGSGWLSYTRAPTLTRDPANFPDYSAQLTADMVQETRLFVDNLVRERRPVLDIIDANYSFVNSRLASVYGVPGVGTNDGFKKVQLPAAQRSGILTHASILTITARDTATAPVLRGLWVTEKILCQEPPPAPANVPPLEEVDVTRPIKERLAIHRASVACAGCHRLMDPIGIGMENYDSIGKWRTHDGTHNVDSIDEIDGRRFNGPMELAQLFRTQYRSSVLNCAAEHLAVYALGRDLSREEHCFIENMANATAAPTGPSFEDMIIAMVKSDIFRKQAVQE